MKLTGGISDESAVPSLAVSLCCPYDGTGSNLLVLLIAVRESVDVGVVEEGLVAITPWESLGANAEVLVGDKLRGVLMITGERVEHAQTNSRQRYQQ